MMGWATVEVLPERVIWQGIDSKVWQPLASCFHSQPLLMHLSSQEGRSPVPPVSKNGLYVTQLAL